jgi:hypothetical protein
MLLFLVQDMANLVEVRALARLELTERMVKQFMVQEELVPLLPIT